MGDEYRMSQALTVVVVGTGFIGPVHVEGLRRLGIHVAGIVGSSAESSHAAANQLGLPDHYDSLQSVLDDDTVDVVHLATPNHLHFEQAKAVLAAGKHVLCEKPLAMNSQESAALVALADSTRQAAGVCYNIRYYPLCHEASHRVQRPSFGKTIHVVGSYAQDWLLFESDFNWRVLADDGGALRAVADIGTHWLDLVQFVTGLSVTSVCADLQTVHPIRQRPSGRVETFSDQVSTSSDPILITTEDAACLMLRFETGSQGCLWVSQTTAGRKNCLRFEISGARESIAWDSENPNSLWLGHRDQANEWLTRDPALMNDQAKRFADYPGGHNEGFADSFKQLFRSFYDDIVSGNFQRQPSFPTFADGHREVLLCEAVLTSHRERRWVDVDLP